MSERVFRGELLTASGLVPLTVDKASVERHVVEVHVGLTETPTVEASPIAALSQVSGGTRDYEQLDNKPSIAGVTLVGDKTLPQIGVGLISNQDIDKMIYGG